jgi:glucose/mannose transport system permease protein
MRRSFGLARLGIYLALLIACLFFLTPIYVVAVTSLKGLDELRHGNMMQLPQTWTFSPWLKAWSSACTGADCNGLRPFFFNSILIVVPSVILSSALGCVNGYALSKWRFPGADTIFTIFLLGLFIPYQAIILPAARFLGFFGISNTIPGLIVIHVCYGIAFTTMLFRNFYASVPQELVKAARVDGADFFLILWRIFLPISLPIFAVCIIWQFTQIWNDFLFGVVFTGPDSRPVTVALNNFVNAKEGVQEYNVNMAAAVITALPTLLVYILGGRYFVRGLVSGSVKG